MFQPKEFQMLVYLSLTQNPSQKKVYLPILSKK